MDGWVGELRDDNQKMFQLKTTLESVRLMIVHRVNCHGESDEIRHLHERKKRK